MKKDKIFDYRYIICIAITLAIAGGLGYIFRASFLRLFEAVKDFGLCIAFYFCETFDIPHGLTVHVNEFSSVLPRLDIPGTAKDFASSFVSYFKAFSDKTVFFEYLIKLGVFFKKFSYILVLVLPLVFVLYIIKTQSDNTIKNDYAKDSKALVLAKKFGKKVYRPVKSWVLSFRDFCREKHFFVVWFWELFFIFNLATVCVEFLAFYFWFVSAWDFSTVFIQISKLCIDIYPTIRFIPLPLWILFGWLVFCRWRKKIGYSVLNHNEMKNRGYINERPIVTMICGNMGKGKTTKAVDMALSQQAMFRDKALDILIELDLKFPNFPWINLENAIKVLIANRVIYNLATIDEFFKLLEQNFIQPNEQSDNYILDCLKDLNFKNELFDYEYQRYGLYSYDELEDNWIFDVLREYAKAYLIYIVQSVYLISNLSIRIDETCSNVGNLPLWNCDFFHGGKDTPSRFAHIIDFDAFRLGKKLCADNQKSNFFEFGIVLITEIGKERGNSKENKEYKKLDSVANQNNDRFNDFLKMIRHSATVYHYPFVKVFVDEQRSSSWGADATELCEIVRIVEKSEQKLAIPFFALEKAIFDVLRPKFESWYINYRFRRGDYTLPYYIKKTVLSKLFSWYERNVNIFGYYKLSVQIEDGAKVEVPKNNYYYLSRKKIYSNRFRSDCFADFFYSKSRNSSIGLDDVPEFEDVLARLDELQTMNSYFYNNLENLLK